ncbi:hypothetical protein CHLRE_12g550153v5 [Chlamydomonas reinhardtii]|uniref:Uncharacterized protein n=1 Tax=Chlamydomonas reinhardtii TaxID=3055 RepID=A0A2K3D684_CHLRE|nr:uncharacterized protein CHLRE_12g550153v5 [Chlamydomonas reinhardtii]PNW76042.1 hypothetical protein CHLRE_12g550153v5 [Chlamydomonas reinhardtii]
MDLISWASSQERVLRAEKVLAPPSVPTVAYAAQTPRPKIRTQTATRARQQRAATRASAPAAATARADPQPSGRDGWQPANRRGSKRAADGPALNPLQLTRIRHSSGRLLSMVEKEMCDTRGLCYFCFGQNHRSSECPLAQRDGNGGGGGGGGGAAGGGGGGGVRRRENGNGPRRAQAQVAEAADARD